MVVIGAPRRHGGGEGREGLRFPPLGTLCRPCLAVEARREGLGSAVGAAWACDGGGSRRGPPSTSAHPHFDVGAKTPLW